MRIAVNRRSRLKGRLAASAAGLALASGLSAGAWAAPAGAWVWSAQVTVSGTLNQCTDQGLQSARVDASFNGQRVVSSTPLGQPPHYSVTFTNVPSGGGWAWIVVSCAVVGGSQGHWVHVYRPVLGSTLGVNL